MATIDAFQERFQELLRGGALISEARNGALRAMGLRVKRAPESARQTTDRLDGYLEKKRRKAQSYYEQEKARIFAQRRLQSQPDERTPPK